MRRITYDVPDKGLATDFTEVEVPLRYAQRFRNRYITRLGGAEKRRGVAAVRNALPQVSTVTGVHELISPVGGATLFTSTNGQIYRYDDPDWTLVHTMTLSTARLRSVQMRDKLIFFNGVDRQVFTEDGTTFKELKALLEVGLAGSDTSATAAVCPARSSDLGVSSTSRPAPVQPASGSRSRWAGTPSGTPPRRGMPAGPWRRAATPASRHVRIR